MKIIQDSQRNISIEIEKISNRPFYSMRYCGDDCFDENSYFRTISSWPVLRFK